MREMQQKIVALETWQHPTLRRHVQISQPSPSRFHFSIIESSDEPLSAAVTVGGEVYQADGVAAVYARTHDDLRPFLGAIFGLTSIFAVFKGYGQPACLLPTFPVTVLFTWQYLRVARRRATLLKDVQAIVSS